MVWWSNFENLPLHQIEGIRFLLRKFKKKDNGAILNDPSGYGKRLQVVQFLVAIQSLITKPVLILCPEQHTINNWVEHFHKWTTLSDYVTVESSNIFAASKKVFINDMENIKTFSRRHWSVLIINDDFIEKDLLGNIFKADFKVWATSVNMKECLQKFYVIYKWMNPDIKWNIKDIIAKSSKPTDVLAQNIKLDFFFEDNVLRRKLFPIPFEVAKRLEPMIIESPKKSKKNKDASGTKIKRSKWRSADNTNNVPGSSTEVTNNPGFAFNESNKDIKCHNKTKNIPSKDIDNMDFTNNDPRTNVLTLDEESRQVAAGSNKDTSNNTNASALVETEPEMSFSEAIHEVVENENNTNDSDKVTRASIICNKERLIFHEDNQSQKDFDNELETEVENNYSNDKAKDVETAADATNINMIDKVPNKSHTDVKTDAYVNENKSTGVKAQDNSSPDIKQCNAVSCANTKSFDDQTNLEEKHVEKESAKHKLETDDLSEFEKNLLKKFKGSYLDRLF